MLRAAKNEELGVKSTAWNWKIYMLKHLEHTVLRDNNEHLAGGSSSTGVYGSLWEFMTRNRNTGSSPRIIHRLNHAD